MERYLVSDEQREALVKFYEQGMQSKGKSCSSLHLQAQEETNLPISVILNWISNYKRKSCEKDKLCRKSASDREPTQQSFKRPRLLSAPNCYNVHVAEFLKSEEGRYLSTTKEKYLAAAEKWRGLTDEEKSEYKDRAKDFMTTKEITWPKVQKTMKQMHSEAEFLSNAGVETVTLHFHKGEVFSGGSEKGLQFLKEHPVVELSFSSYFFEKAAEEDLPADSISRVTSKQLVREVEDIFKQKYAIASGRVGSVPYDDKSIRIEIKGLPRNIEYKKPSLYGVRQLRTIINNKDKFEFCVQVGNDVLNEHSYSACSSNSSCSESNDQEIPDLGKEVTIQVNS